MICLKSPKSSEFASLFILKQTMLILSFLTTIQFLKIEKL